MTDAFDADVLIYSVVADHPLGRRVAALLSRGAEGGPVGSGSVLLLPEVIAKPLREGVSGEVRLLAAALGRLDLRPVGRATAELATVLAAKYGLRAADAIHLATAVEHGDQRFITNNARDFPQTITEIDITYPGDLPDVD